MLTHTTPALRVVASACACGLVIASAGFGAVFAWQIGIQHGIVLAVLTVLFAVALEGIEPLAISAALQALGSWSLIRGVALLALGTVAIAYSLTSELTLMSGSRGDLSAKREQASDASQRARESHQRAKAELATLRASRPIGELEALLESTRTSCRVNVGNGYRQTVCTKSPALVAELGRAKRKAELEAILDRSEVALATTPAVRASDPGSQAMATYLAALGVTVSVDVVAQWLNLIPVLAIELGSALAMVLVQAMPQGGSRRTIETPAIQSEPTPVPALPRPTAHRDAVARAIVDHVRNQGGLIKCTERGLARVLGADRSTLRRAMEVLVVAKRMQRKTTRQGSLMRISTHV